MRRSLLGATGLILTIGLSQTNAGTILPDRASLNSLLGASARTENFELFNLAGPTLEIFSSTLSSTTVVPAQFGIPSQGPGLIIEGLTFSSQGGGLRINGFTAPTKALEVTGSGPRTLTIDFSIPVNAFGFNFFPTVTTGTNVDLKIFDPGDTMVLEEDQVKVFFANQFIGVSESQGIGKVQLTALATDPFNIFDITMDNVTFGFAQAGAVPEPATWLLLGTGLVGMILWRKRTA